MKDRPSFPLLAFALFSVGAFAQETDQAEFTTTIKGGNIIKGDIVSIDPKSSTTRLRFEHAREPIDVKTESILSIKRNTISEPMEKSGKPTDMIVLSNGDRFPAKVGVIDSKDGTSIDTDYSWSYTLPAGSLQRISFGLATLPLFSGPREGQEWVLLPTEDPTIEVKNGAINIKSSGSAAIDARLTDCSIIDLTLPASQRPYLSFALGSNALDASDKDNPDSPPLILASEESNSFFPGNAYIVRTSSRTLTMQGATMTPEGRVRYSDLGIRFSLPDTGLSRRLSIGFNRRDKILAFWVDGEYLGKYVENGDWIGTGSAIVIGASSSQSEATVTGITVRQWHGVIGDEFAAKGMQSKDVVTLTTGERFTGSLVSKSASDVIFETSLSKMTFTASDVATIDFGTGEDLVENKADEQAEPEETPEPETPVEDEELESDQPSVRFGGIYSLQGDAFQFSGDQLEFVHPILGKVTLPFMVIDSIKLR